MYKVFIDNWTLILREDFKNSQLDSTKSCFFSDSTTLKELATLALSNVNQDVELYFTGKIDKVLKKLFSSYKWVEAAGGIVRKGDKYLVIYRHGKWDLPKGKIDKGEEVEAAAVREIEEECGITSPEIIRPLMNTYHTYHIYGPETIKKTYWFELSYSGNENLVPQENEGITRVEWVDKQALFEIKKDTFPSIAELLDNFLA